MIIRRSVGKGLQERDWVLTGHKLIPPYINACIIYYFTAIFEGIPYISKRGIEQPLQWAFTALVNMYHRLQSYPHVSVSKPHWLQWHLLLSRRAYDCALMHILLLCKDNFQQKIIAKENLYLFLGVSTLWPVEFLCQVPFNGTFWIYQWPRRSKAADSL